MRRVTCVSGPQFKIQNEGYGSPSLVDQSGGLSVLMMPRTWEYSPAVYVPYVDLPLSLAWVGSAGPEPFFKERNLSVVPTENPRGRRLAFGRRLVNIGRVTPLAFGRERVYSGTCRPFRNPMLNVKNSPRFLANLIKNHLSAGYCVTHESRNREPGQAPAGIWR